MGAGAYTNSRYSDNAVAIGLKAGATAENALAFGNTAKASNYNSVAIGANTIASKMGSIAIGGAGSSLDTFNTKAAKAQALGAIAIGAGSEVTGLNTVVADTVAGGYGIALGAKSIVSAPQGMALGYNARVNAGSNDMTGGVALGANSFSGTAILAGWDPKTNGVSTDTAAKWKATAQAVAIGNVDSTGNAPSDKDRPLVTRQIQGLAAGQQDTDAVNVAQLKAVKNLITSAVSGSSVKYVSINSTATGPGTNADNDGAKGVDSIAIGRGAQVQNTWTQDKADAVVGKSAAEIDAITQLKSQYATAIGFRATANLRNALAIGTMANANGNAATSIGNGATSKGEVALAIGQSANAAAQHSTALGGFAAAKLENAVALGYYSQANGNNATALGSNTVVNVDDGVALGSSSVASVDSSVYGYDPVSNKALTLDTVLDAFDKTSRQNYEAKSQAYNDAQKKIDDANAEITRLENAKTAENEAQFNQLINAQQAIITQAETDRDNAELVMTQLISAWQSTSGAVSVGSSEGGITRQITNVAAGTNPTDAVNVAQLQLLANAPVYMYGVTKNGDNYEIGSQIGEGKFSLNNLRFAFGDGLKADVKQDKDNVLYVSLDKSVLKNDGDFKGDKGDQGLPGAKGDKGDKGDTGLAGRDGVNGKDGKDGKNGTDAKELDKDSVVTVKEVRTSKTTMNDKGVTINQSDKTVSVTENGLDNGNNKVVNVAPGTISANSRDAVNGSQLHATNQAVAANSANIARLDGKINQVSRDLRAGVASAVAIGGLYHATTPGKSMVSAGVGTYKGQNAVAVSYSQLSGNGKVGVKLSLSGNTQGDTAASASVGYQW